MLLQDLRTQLAPITASFNKTFCFSDEDTVTSELGTQTDGELSPLIIKPKKYSKKKNTPQLDQDFKVSMV